MAIIELQDGTRLEVGDDLTETQIGEVVDHYVSTQGGQDENDLGVSGVRNPAHDQATEIGNAADDLLLDNAGVVPGQVPTTSSVPGVGAVQPTSAEAGTVGPGVRSAPDSETPGILDTYGPAIHQAATFYLGDEARGAGSFLRSLIGGEGLDAAQQAYVTDRDEARAELARSREAAPIGSLVAEGVTGAAIGGPMALGRGLLGAIGTGAAAGGLTGFGASEEDELGDLAQDVAIGAATGAALSWCRRRWRRVALSEQLGRGARTSFSELPTDPEHVRAAFGVLG